MSEAVSPTPIEPEVGDARDLQSRLYREIGISAVAAALRFITQPDPETAKPAPSPMPAVGGEDDIAA